jgi:glucokinase
VDYAVGIDVGATRLKMAAVAPDGRILEETSDPEAGGPDPVRGRLRALEARRGAPARWVGVAAPGIAAPDGRRIFWMQGRLDWLEGLCWADALGRREPVPVLNDAQAALLAETWTGAAVGCRNVALLTLGTGVGGAAICDGRLLGGAIGRAGHLGHLSLDAGGPPDVAGTPGSLEYFVGEYSLPERTGRRFSSTRDLVEACERGDAGARAAWSATLRALAAGIASLINILDPERFIIGGGIAAAGDALFGPLREFMDRFEWRPHGHGVPIVPAAGGAYAGAVGAACRAIRSAEGAP